MQWLIEVHVSTEMELSVNPHYEIKGKDSGNNKFYSGNFDDVE